MQHKLSLPCGGITDKIIDCYYKTIDSLGIVRGISPRAFRNKLAIAIKAAGLRVQTDKEIEVWDNGKIVDTINVEMVVEGLVLVSVRRVQRLTTTHYAEGTYQMEVGGYPVGLLLNYGEKDRKIRRFARPRRYQKGPWKCPGE
jgi:GxxExxY protein